MESKISPSLMCANLNDLENEIKTLERLEVDFLHIDFMDGRFVPNTAFSVNQVRDIKHISDTKRDIHIMAFNPEAYFDKMEIGENDFVSVHYEACKDINKVLIEIKKRGATPCVAISPDTSVTVVENCIDNIDAVLLMTVYPGFAGQPLAKGSFEKIHSMRAFLNNINKESISIEVDGNVSFENCVKMRESGADIFVAGSSSVFSKNYVLNQTVPKFKNLIY